MTTVRQRRFLLVTLSFTVLLVAVLASTASLSADVLVSLSFVGFLLVTALTAPVHVMPRWRRRLRIPLYLGGAVFLALIGYRTAETLLRAF